MRKFLLLCALLLSFAATVSAQPGGTAIIYVYDTSLSGVKCQTTQRALWIIKSGASAGVYRCSAADTFTAIGGSGDVSGPASSVDSEVALFSGAGGKTLKRATTTGILKGASGVLSAAVAGTDYESPLTFNSPLSRSLNAVSCATCAVTGSGLNQFASTTSAQLAGVISDKTGTGALYFQGGALGTPSGATLTNATGLPVSTGVSGLASGMATFLGAAQSSNLRSALTDEVGVGAAVFATSPRFTTDVAPASAGGASNGTASLGWSQLYLDKTFTAAGTTGAQTINKALFSVNFAASASSLVVTNSTVAATSGVVCTVNANDSTLKSVAAVPASGGVTLNANAAATAETRVTCVVWN